MTQTLALGLVCWLLTIIIVDSVLLRPARRRLGRWARRGEEASLGGLLATWLQTLDGNPPALGWRGHLAYLVTCNLCAGTWIGLGLALLAGGPFDVPLVGWVLSGLLYKAIGHLTYAVQRALEGLAR